MRTLVSVGAVLVSLGLPRASLAGPLPATPDQWGNLVVAAVTTTDQIERTLRHRRRDVVQNWYVDERRNQAVLGVAAVVDSLHAYLGLPPSPITGWVVGNAQRNLANLEAGREQDDTNLGVFESMLDFDAAYMATAAYEQKAWYIFPHGRTWNATPAQNFDFRDDSAIAGYFRAWATQALYLTGHKLDLILGDGQALVQQAFESESGPLTVEKFPMYLYQVGQKLKESSETEGVPEPSGFTLALLAAFGTIAANFLMRPYRK